ncbi:MAG: glycogen debranching protein GlgX [Acidimicrobiia bacterium]
MVRVGTPYPQGATWDGSGTNFAVFAEQADFVELCLFDEQDTETRFKLPGETAFVHHGYLPGVGPEQLYGFRVHGTWEPRDGLLHNPNKLLLDPYARAVAGPTSMVSAVFSSTADEPLAMNQDDSAAFVPRSVVVDTRFDWGEDRPPSIPLHQTVIYETHVKGISAAHPKVPESLRGTYAGMASDPVVDHLVTLGVTAVELLPVHQFISEHSVIERGFTNYWGYSSVGFFAPHGEYAASDKHGGQVTEFKHLVKTLHAAGIEVLLDVVYNHTGESGPLGPTLGFRGIDNAAYYRLDPADRSRYVDFTGTGNTLDVRHPQVLSLIMDSLRYWVEEMHVDGFRFDLAAALARDANHFDKMSAFFDLVHQDPVLRTVKLIAEPWDLGEGGYRVGDFPPQWSEWNGKYRDDVRDYWRGEPSLLATFASRITGSSDIYESAGRAPQASINFVTAHDGFTLSDLVSYDNKHNQGNGEGNRDGEAHNRSWNSGVEGPTDDPAVLSVRARRARAILTTLMLSQGVPMLLGGDEFGRTKGGNNNSYNQDNAVSWYDWEDADEDMFAYTQELIRLRQDHPVFRRRTFLGGTPVLGPERQDIVWYNTDGSVMSEADWTKGYAKSLAVYLNGNALASPDELGERVIDDSFLVLFNAHSESVRFEMPDDLAGLAWEIVLYSATGLAADLPVEAPETGDVAGWSVAVLRKRNGMAT